jgi:hypothetical protein
MKIVQYMVFTLGVDTKFRNKNYFHISLHCRIISRNFVKFRRWISRKNCTKFREKIAQNFAKHCQFGGLDAGHAPTQIGQDSKIGQTIEN